MALDLSILHKLLIYLERMSDDLESKNLTPSDLESNEDLLFSVEHRLHTAIESVFDIAEHIVSGLNLGHPDKSKDTLKILAKNQIISDELAEKMGEASDMRNILVHQYFEVDPKEIVKAVQNDLQDLRDFAKAINEFLEKYQQQNP